MRTTDRSSGQHLGMAPASGVEAAFRALLGLPDGLLSDRTRADLGDARDRLAEGRCNLVVLGEFKRGKSTLVNALLGRALLPTGVLPLTSVVTVVRGAPRDRLIVHFTDGRCETLTIPELARYATEAANPGNELGVELTILETVNPALDRGLQLVDTPGIGSVYAHNTEAAHAFVARTDAAILVLSADQPLSAQERELLATVDRIAGRVLVVLNRIDVLDAPELADAISFVERTVAAAGASVPAVMPVSAREGTGIDALRRWIDELRRSDGDGWAASERAARRALARAAAEAQTAARLELAALELPLTQLDERARGFDERVNTLAPAREAASAVLERGVATLLRERSTEPLRLLATEASPHLCEALRRTAAEHAARSARQLRAQLMTQVDEAVHRLMEHTATRIEADIKSGLDDLVTRYAAHVDGILAGLADGVAEAFGERPVWATPAIDAGERPPMRYKLRDEDEALGAAVSAVRAAVPGPMGRRLVLREQEARLRDMIDRHAGRLREQVTEQTMSAAREYQTRLRSVVDEVTDGVNARIARARSDIALGADRVSQRRAALRTAVAACVSVEHDRGAGGRLP